MSDSKFYGCVVLSSAMRKVLLVKPCGFEAWSFPIGTVEALEGVEAAARLVEEQTRVSVYGLINAEEFVEAPFPPGAARLARLYIVHSVKTTKPSPAADAAIEDVAWRDFRSVLELPDVTPFEDEAVMPFLSQLREWIHKQEHHHLRERSDMDLGRAVLYNSKHHGSKQRPTHVLVLTLRNNGFADPHYIPFLASAVKFADDVVPKFSQPTYGCTCVLPHAGLNITPEICYLVEEDAREMAALAGVLYLAGGIDHNTKSFHFAPMGSAPPQIAFWNETLAAHACRHREGALLNDEMTYWQNPGHNMIPRSNALQHKFVIKTPVSLLEDFCMKHGYALKFEFESKRNGYTALISIPDLGFARFDGEWKEHRREAKESAATLMLELLKERGLYV